MYHNLVNDIFLLNVQLNLNVLEQLLIYDLFTWNQ